MCNCGFDRPGFPGRDFRAVNSERRAGRAALRLTQTFTLPKITSDLPISCHSSNFPGVRTVSIYRKNAGVIARPALARRYSHAITHNEEIGAGSRRLTSQRPIPTDTSEMSVSANPRPAPSYFVTDSLYTSIPVCCAHTAARQGFLPSVWRDPQTTWILQTLPTLPVSTVAGSFLFPELPLKKIVHRISRSAIRQNGLK